MGLHGATHVGVGAGEATTGPLATVQAYVGLTKPRIIELLLVTTVPVMFLAARGVPSLWLVAVTLAGGILSAGAANTFNCVYDRDIDAVMHRTEKRPMATGEITPLYASSVTGSKITLYAQDGSLKVYDTDTGALLTDVNAGTIGDDQRVTLDCEEDGFVWMELRDADSYEIAAIRVYGPEGLVSDLSSLNETYNYLGYLTTDANGRPLYYGTRSVPGSSYATGCDVLDETGNVVMQGLGSCYSYYDNSLNALPDHVFVARRGFYYGWMDTDGNWLYCQSIFSSVNADDELGY